jgi:hypothetical protein
MVRVSHSTAALISLIMLVLVVLGWWCWVLCLAFLRCVSLRSALWFALLSDAYPTSS